MKRFFKISIIICIVFILVPKGNTKEEIKPNPNIENTPVPVIEFVPNTNKQIEDLRKEFDNQEIKAVISSKSLELESVVVQTNNNEFYMNHDARRERDIKGSLFFDYRNNLDSKKLLIYGHNSRTLQTDFKKLTKFLEEEFAKNNPYIYLTTEKEISKWKIFSIMIIPKNTTTHTRIEFSSSKELSNHISWLIDNSIIDFEEDVELNDQLMTLQTCFYEPKDSFLLVNFKKVGDNNE